MKINRIYRGQNLKIVFGILALVLILLVGIAGAQPYAYITNHQDDTVSVIDTANDTVITNVSVGHWPYGVAVNTSGNKVYVTNNAANTISVINTSTYQVTTVPVGSGPTGIALNPAGTTVYVGNFNDKNVSVIDTATDTIITNVSVDNQPSGVAVSPDGTKVYVATSSNTVSVIDTSTYKVTSVPVGACPNGVVVSPDGTKVYVTNDCAAGGVSVIDTLTNQVTTIPISDRGGYSGPFGIAVAPDGKKVYVTEHDFNNISVIDTATNTVLATVPVGGGPNGVAITPDGTKVYVANGGDSTVSVINTTTNGIIDTVYAVQGHGDPIAFGQFIGSSTVIPSGTTIPPMPVLTPTPTATPAPSVPAVVTPAAPSAPVATPASPGPSGTTTAGGTTTGGNPWETSVGQNCFEQWITEAMSLLNAYNGDSDFNKRKPWSINKYGVLEGNPQFGPISVSAPDDFAQHNNNKYWWMWDHYTAETSWTNPNWNGAKVPFLRDYVTKCIAHGGIGG